MPEGPSRRALLAASASAAALLATACRGVQVLGAPPPTPPDIRLMRSVIAAEQLMVTRYKAAIAQASTASQAVSAQLSTVLAEHEQHLTQLTSRLIEPPGYKPSPARAESSGAAAQPGLTATIAALASDEQAAADRLGGQLLLAPPSVAQLLASIAASEATHVPVLQALGRTR